MARSSSSANIPAPAAPSLPGFGISSDRSPATRGRQASPRRRLASFAALTLLLGGGGAALAGTYPVDDSYTIARRFAQYRDEYPGIALPAFAPQAGQRIDFDLAYKNAGERDLHIDVFRPVPARNRRQGLVLVHGGAWRSGSKAHFYALANRLAQRGYTVFLPEYRLAPEAPYPAGMRDIADALAWAQANAATYGVPPSRIALGGASSGGQMAALLAYRGGTAFGAVAATPNALVDLDGVLDMTTPLALGFENAAGTTSPFALWVGGSFDQQPQRWREASAATHVGTAAPPTLIISSSAPRFTAGREAVLATLKANGIRGERYTFARSPHDLWLFEPYLGVAVERIDRFLRAVAADAARKGHK